jgi:hypothetical protein
MPLLRNFNPFYAIVICNSHMKGIFYISVNNFMNRKKSRQI